MNISYQRSAVEGSMKLLREGKEEKEEKLEMDEKRQKD